VVGTDIFGTFHSRRVRRRRGEPHFRLRLASGLLSIPPSSSEMHGGEIARLFERLAQGQRARKVKKLKRLIGRSVVYGQHSWCRRRCGTVFWCDRHHRGSAQRGRYGLGARSSSLSIHGVQASCLGMAKSWLFMLRGSPTTVIGAQGHCDTSEHALLTHSAPATSTPYCSARADVRKDAAIIRPLGCTALAARNPACPLAESDKDSG
jgi:hypothetical protein